jgi:hypothetical protein
MVASTTAFLAAGKFGLAPTVKNGTNAACKLQPRANAAGLITNDPSGAPSASGTDSRLGCSRGGPGLLAAAAGWPASCHVTAVHSSCWCRYIIHDVSCSAFGLGPVTYACFIPPPFADSPAALFMLLQASPLLTPWHLVPWATSLVWALSWACAQLVACERQVFCTSVSSSPCFGSSYSSSSTAGWHGPCAAGPSPPPPCALK